MTEWIKCSERLPDTDFDYDDETIYLIYSHHGLGALCYDQRSWDFLKITHWALPPKTPDEIEKERAEYENSPYCKYLTQYVNRFFEQYRVPKEIPDSFKGDYDFYISDRI